MDPAGESTDSQRYVRRTKQRVADVLKLFVVRRDLLVGIDIKRRRLFLDLMEAGVCEDLGVERLVMNSR